jgi:hypothetical protein
MVKPAHSHAQTFFKGASLALDANKYHNAGNAQSWFKPNSGLRFLNLNEP